MKSISLLTILYRNYLLKAIPNLHYTYDSLYNRTRKNEQSHEFNELNQRLSTSYDLNGNQTTKQTPTETFYLTYDPLNRLIEAHSENKKIKFSYDPLGRCLSKKIYEKSSNWQETEHEDYIYHGQHEIGAFTSKKPKNFRVLGLESNNCPQTVSIELNGQIFAPIQDVQGNIRKLIDLTTGYSAHSYEFTAFGEELTPISLPNPWRFASKRFDEELGLINFGKRYYDPEFARWLTPDPAGFIDSSNLYQYVFNNPFKYRDPDGQFAFVLAIPLLTWGGGLSFTAITAVATQIGYAAITGAALYGGYKAIERINKIT